MKKRLRDLLKGKSRQCLKWVPNSLTLCNSLCGFAAILVTLRAYEKGYDSMDVYTWSVWLILFAMVFDALDGYAARIFNAASLHGMQMDSLADMVTFGVAPATLIAIMTHSLRDSGWGGELLVYALCSVYLGGAALRLATYNVHALQEKKSDGKFSGLPSPGAAAAVGSVVIFARTCSLEGRSLALALPIYAAILGLLMVSRVPYVHVGKWLGSLHRSWKRQLVALALVLVVAIFRGPGLVAVITAYVFSGPFTALWRLTFSRKKGNPCVI